MENRIRGRIKSLKRNYGFIEGSDRNDYFFHWTMLNESTKTFKQLEEGNTTSFVPKKISDSELHATDINILD